MSQHTQSTSSFIRSGDVELSAAGAYKVLPGLLQHTFFALGHSLKLLFGWNDLICFIDRLTVKFFIKKKQHRLNMIFYNLGK